MKSSILSMCFNVKGEESNSESLISFIYKIDTMMSYLMVKGIEEC